MIKGEAQLLATGGQLQAEQLRRLNISEKDLLEDLRTNGHLASVDQAGAVYLERNGRISVVKS